MERVLIIGSPGAGKSTLAAQLARRTGLPLIHLDQEYWRAGWIETPEDEWLAKVEALTARPRWIMDGNYGGSLPLRLTCADTVVYLQLPPWRCVARIVRRIIGSWGRVRPDMAEGCPEQLNWEFLIYTARFRRDRRASVEAKLRAFGGTLISLRTQRDIDHFLEGFQSEQRK
jgi:adenylate kinase family enzyme